MNSISQGPLWPDSQTFIDHAVKSLDCAPLRRMLAAFIAQPEIHAVLSTPVGGGVQQQRTGLCRYVVQVLRSAADTAAYCSEFGGAEREALFVSIFIEGCRAYLRACVDVGSDVDDVLHTLVMDPLRNLGRQDEHLAGLVRMCLGWGLADEVDDFYVPRLRNCVCHALSRISVDGNTVASNFLPRVGDHSAANLLSY